MDFNRILLLLLDHIHNNWKQIIKIKIKIHNSI